MDHFLYRFLEKAFDLVVLNLLFVLCCMPVVTAGASAAALSRVCLKMVKNEEGPVIREFFQAFRRNWKQSTVLWLFFLGFWILWGWELTSLWNMNSLLSGILLLVGAIVLAAMIYVFPLVCRFSNTNAAMLRNAFLFPWLYPGRTLCMLVLVVLSVLITLANQLTVIIGGAAWTVIGFAGLNYICSGLLRSVLDDLAR